MFSFNRIALRNGTHTDQVSGISDIQSYVIDGDRFVFVTSQANGLITSYKVSATGTLTFEDQLQFTGAGTPSGLQLLEIDGDLIALPTGHSTDNLGAFQINNSGVFTAQTTVLGDAAQNGNVWAAASFTLDTGTVVYTSQAGIDGLVGYKLLADGSLEERSTQLDDKFQTYDAHDIKTAIVGGVKYMFAASQSDNSISSYWIRPNGVAKFQAKVGVEQNLGIAVPSHLDIVEIAGETFILMASAGSSSITVLNVLSDGNMIVTDHIIDEQTTRFQSISVFETITVNERVFVGAGGGDDGLSMMELLPNGTLLHHDTIADQLNTSLGNVAGLSLFVSGGDIQVYAGGENDTGITHFEIDLGAMGQSIVGTTGNDTLNGTSLGDVLLGDSGNDIIKGKDGNDILVDGAGNDTLEGGNGADIFALSSDKQHDIILDFELGVDRLDLSNYELLRNIGQIDVETHSDGATLTFFSETLRIYTSDNSSIDANDVAAMAPIQLSHMMIGLSPQDLTIEGGTADDALVGGLGNDILLGQDGNDVLNGGAGSDLLEGGLGEDCADYSLALIGITVDLSGTIQNTGEAAGDILVSIEHVLGSAHKDVIFGNEGVNDLAGGEGSDTIAGNRGADILTGGKGRDTLNGQRGNDKLVGEEGRDVLNGGRGHDTLSGRKGQDVLNGGPGDDVLTGGLGQDQFIFNSGSDVVKDFENNVDEILLDRSVLADGSMTKQEVLNTYASMVNGNAVLDFGNGDVLTIENVNSLAVLPNDFILI